MNNKKEEMRESPRGRSVFSLYKACPRRWAFKYLKGFQPVGNVDALNLGSAIHETQALWYKGSTLEHCLWFLDAFLKENNSDHLKGKAVAMFKDWATSLGTYDRENCIPLAIEKESEVTLPNGFKMTVRWDRVLLDKKTDEVFISDTKTTSGSASRTIQMYHYSDQPKLYIASVLQNKPEWFNQFKGWRTDAIYGRELKSGHVNTEVIRSELVTYSEKEIEDVLISYAILIDDIKFHVQNVLNGKESIQGNFYGNNENCYSYGRVCPYYSFCAEIDNIKEHPRNFTLDPWLESGEVLKSLKEQ